MLSETEIFCCKGIMEKLPTKPALSSERGIFIGRQKEKSGAVKIKFAASYNYNVFQCKCFVSNLCKLRISKAKFAHQQSILLQIHH